MHEIIENSEKSLAAGVKSAEEALKNVKTLDAEFQSSRKEVDNNVRKVMAQLYIPVDEGIRE